MTIVPSGGVVLVKRPGSTAFVPVKAGVGVAVGSVLDARRGTITLGSAGAGHRTQQATFHGGEFEVRQSPRGGGVTDIVLRGGSFTACRRHIGRRPRGLASTARHRRGAGRPRGRVVRQLWSKDHGGRFRTYGHNSVATVRGTEWLTVDRCDGTLTRVLRGQVSVRDLRRRRSVLVRAGHRYLARAGR